MVKEITIEEVIHLISSEDTLDLGLILLPQLENPVLEYMLFDTEIINKDELHEVQKARKLLLKEKQITT